MKTFRTAIILAIIIVFFKFLTQNGNNSDESIKHTTQNIINQMQNEYKPIKDFSFLDLNHSSNITESKSVNQTEYKNLKNEKKELFIKMQILKKEIHISPPGLIVDVKIDKNNPYFDNEKFFKIATQAVIFTFCNQEANVFSASKRAYLILNITNGLYSKSFNLNDKFCNSLNLSLLDQITDDYTIVLKPKN